MTGRQTEFLLKNVTAEVKAEIIKAIRDLGKYGCAKVNKVIEELRNAGARIPKMDNWSCDQKIAFVAALGPSGVACLLAGALTGALAVNTVKEFDRCSKNAERAAKAVADKAAGVAAGVGNTAHSVGKKLGL